MCVWRRSGRRDGGRRKVCVRLQLHHTSVSDPVTCRGVVHPSNLSPRLCCQKASQWQITGGWCSARFSPGSLSFPPEKVQNPPALCIYQSHRGNLHSRGQTLVFWLSALGWRRLNTNQKSDLPCSFIKQRPLLGSRVVCSLSLPSGIWRELWAKG